MDFDELSPDDQMIFFTHLIGTILEQCTFRYITYRGEKYSSGTTHWYTNTHKNSHKPEECHGHDECDHRRVLFDGTQLDLVFTISTPKTINKRNIHDFETCDSKIRKLILNFWNTEKEFTTSKTIMLVNASGLNEDHRGSDHFSFGSDTTIHELPFTKTRNLGSSVSLESVVDAVYRIKSHRTDNWYELFCRVDKMIHTKNRIEIELKFDHGS